MKSASSASKSATHSAKPCLPLRKRFIAILVFRLYSRTLRRVYTRKTAITSALRGPYCAYRFLFRQICQIVLTFVPLIHSESTIGCTVVLQLVLLVFAFFLELGGSMEQRHCEWTDGSPKKRLGRPRYRSRLLRPYAVSLQLHFQEIRQRAQDVHGEGTTFAMSAREVFFTTREALGPGARLETAIDWPMLLDGTTPLQLLVWGTVVRRVGSDVTLWIQRTEFHTRRTAGSLQGKPWNAAANASVCTTI